MRVVLFVLAVLCGALAVAEFVVAATAPGQIFAGILWVSSSVFLVGAGIVDAIVAQKKPNGLIR